MNRHVFTPALAALLLVVAHDATAQDAKMNLFITSIGPGDGANLGGLKGADDHATCNNWTSSAAGSGSARLGHHDRVGGGENPTSWNSAHLSRGCSQENLQATGGNGLFYCFALN